MEGSQQQSTTAPVVCHSCGYPCGSNNRVSATQVPIQEGDGRGEFDSDAALTQPFQGAQAARVQSINPWIPKLTQKPTKVTTTKTVINKEVEFTLYVLNVVYRQELVPPAMLEKVKPVLDTSYEPYVSDGNQEEDKEPEIYRNTERQLVLKKVAAFYTKVPMPCKPVTNQDPISTTPANFMAHNDIVALKSCVLKLGSIKILLTIRKLP
ncbi:hypothetical protein DSO57_1033536 [Entomophthora muscae]|uniref:Uncharacterized protein n=1 Tax=Entomophthora muscae TaxID=34485 RepID=A0ACC2SCZ1_9FUNG|nr:hypothetical protein DSO57_1033536 [Entomophthora muscae]